MARPKAHNYKIIVLRIHFFTTKKPCTVKLIKTLNSFTQKNEANKQEIYIKKLEDNNNNDV